MYSNIADHLHYTRIDSGMLIGRCSKYTIYMYLYRNGLLTLDIVMDNGTSRSLRRRDGSLVDMREEGYSVCWYTGLYQKSSEVFPPWGKQKFSCSVDISFLHENQYLVVYAVDVIEYIIKEIEIYDDGINLQIIDFTGGMYQDTDHIDYADLCK